MKKFITTVLAFGLATAAQSAEWTGVGDFGYSDISGNSNSETLTAALGLGYDTGGKWTHEVVLTAINSSQQDIRAAEAYGLNWNSNYAFNEKNYGVGALRYLDDRFSGFDTQTSIRVGVGRHFIDDGITLLDAEGGIGFRRNELITGEDEDEGIIWGRSVYSRVLSDTTIFDAHGLFEAGDENTYVEAGASIRVAMSEALGLRVAYLLKHNTDAPAPATSTDRFLTVSLNYLF